MADAIPLTASSRQKLTTRLSEQPVELTVWWQPLSAAWYLSLSLAGQPVANGRQLVPWSKLIRFPAFSGDLMVAANPGHEQDAIGREAWNNTHRLVYLTEAEAAAV